MNVRIRLTGTDRLELDQVESAIREVLRVPAPSESYAGRRSPGDPTLRVYLEATGTRPPSETEGQR